MNSLLYMGIKKNNRYLSPKCYCKNSLYFDNVHCRIGKNSFYQFMFIWIWIWNFQLWHLSYEMQKNILFYYQPTYYYNIKQRIVLHHIKIGDIIVQYNAYSIELIDMSPSYLILHITLIYWYLQLELVGTYIHCIHQYYSLDSLGRVSNI